MTLIEEQQNCLELWAQLSERADASNLAGPFLSASALDPNAKCKVLYIGKATGGDYWRNEAANDLEIESRRKISRKFISDDIIGGRYSSPFWEFSQQIAAMTIEAGFYQGKHYGNMIWSNLMRIGVQHGNPSGHLAGIQWQLAAATLQEEVREYQPSLIVLVSGSYMEWLVHEVLGSGWIGESFNAGYQRSAVGEHPPVLWTRHPQGASHQQRTQWVAIAQALLQAGVEG